MTPRETKAYRSGYPNDLRDERWQEALSGPVVTYKAIEELVPFERPRGMFITISRTDGQCLYISRAALDWLIARAERLRLRVDNLHRRLIITPDAAGPWQIARVGKRKTSDGHSGAAVGAGALKKQLLARGFQPGRYEAKVEGDSLVVDCGKE